MRKIVIRMEIEYGGEWENEEPAWVADQAEKVIDNNCGGHATAYVLEVQERTDES